MADYTVTVTESARNDSLVGKSFWSVAESKQTSDSLVGKSFLGVVEPKQTSDSLNVFITTPAPPPLSYNTSEPARSDNVSVVLGTIPLLLSEPSRTDSSSVTLLYTVTENSKNDTLTSLFTTTVKEPLQVDKLFVTTFLNIEEITCPDQLPPTSLSRGVIESPVPDSVTGRFFYSFTELPKTDTFTWGGGVVVNEAHKGDKSVATSLLNINEVLCPDRSLLVFFYSITESKALDSLLGKSLWNIQEILDTDSVLGKSFWGITEPAYTDNTRIIISLDPLFIIESAQKDSWKADFISPLSWLFTEHAKEDAPKVNLYTLLSWSFTEYAKDDYPYLGAFWGFGIPLKEMVIPDNLLVNIIFTEKSKLDIGVILMNIALNESAQLDALATKSFLGLLESQDTDRFTFWNPWAQLETSKQDALSVITLAKFTELQKQDFVGNNPPLVVNFSETPKGDYTGEVSGQPIALTEQRKLDNLTIGGSKKMLSNTTVQQVLNTIGIDNPTQADIDRLNTAIQAVGSWYNEAGNPRYLKNSSAETGLVIASSGALTYGGTRGYVYTYNLPQLSTPVFPYKVAELFVLGGSSPQTTNTNLTTGVLLSLPDAPNNNYTLAFALSEYNLMVYFDNTVFPPANVNNYKLGFTYYKVPDQVRAPGDFVDVPPEALDLLIDEYNYLVSPTQELKVSIEDKRSVLGI